MCVCACVWHRVSKLGHSRTVRLISEARATPELFGWWPDFGYQPNSSGVALASVRPLYVTGLLPDCPNDPKPGCSRTVRPLSEVGSLGLFSWYPKSGYYCARPFLGLPPMKSEHQLTLPTWTLSGATVKARVTKDNARDPSSNSRDFVTTLGDLFSYILSNGGEVSHATQAIILKIWSWTLCHWNIMFHVYIAWALT